jgi:lipoprotein-anchoring transpeptidase ErfK/SrfK
VALTRLALTVSVSKQEMRLWDIGRGSLAPLPALSLIVHRRSSDVLTALALKRAGAGVHPHGTRTPTAICRRRYLVSTSRFGMGQESGSNRTPLGLHRVAEKVGAGHPIGTVFESRRPVGFTWQGMPKAPIAHRILWLEGLEPGFNRGGNVDSHARYIYIHGLADEPSLGRPASRGCIHMAAADLLPLFDRVRLETLVWIEA